MANSFATSRRRRICRRCTVVVQPRRWRLRPRRSSRSGRRQSRAELHLHYIQGKQVRDLRVAVHRGRQTTVIVLTRERKGLNTRSEVWSHTGPGDLLAAGTIPRRMGRSPTCRSAGLQPTPVTAGDPLSDGYVCQRLSAQRRRWNLQCLGVTQPRANCTYQGNHRSRRGR